jgi:hypothetical protein
MKRAGVKGRLTVTPVPSSSGRSRTRIPGGEADVAERKGEEKMKLQGREGVGRGDWTRAEGGRSVIIRKRGESFQRVCGPSGAREAQDAEIHGLFSEPSQSSRLLFLWTEGRARRWRKKTQIQPAVG